VTRPIELLALVADVVAADRPEPAVVVRLDQGAWYVTLSRADPTFDRIDIVTLRPDPDRIEVIVGRAEPNHRPPDLPSDAVALAAIDVHACVPVITCTDIRRITP
jgi:hypothetical protein